MLRVQCLRRSCFVVPPRSDGFKVQSSRFKASRSMPVAFKGSMLRVQRFIHKFTQMDTNGHKCTQMNYGVMSRAVVQSCSRAVVQSCSRAVVQSCSRAVVQSCSRAVVQSQSNTSNLLPYSLCYNNAFPGIFKAEAISCQYLFIAAGM